MSVTQMIWSLDNKEQLQKAKLQSELELENLLAAHIEILDPNWLLLGRQIKTVSGKYIDLLCMDYSGDLIVVELKRDMTPREVTAQAIDYASCMAELKLEEVAELYSRYSGDTKSLNEAYESKYHVELNDESLNCNVRMVIVASQMDTSTERIIKYLREKYGVPINILFFDVFDCDGKRFISRVWFDEEMPDQISENHASNQWNQEYYVSFGQGKRNWQDARKYGFISAGGGTWYTNTLKLLNPGDRIWVNIPKTGYVGVGKVIGEIQQAKDVLFSVDGKQAGFAGLPVKGDYLYSSEDADNAEYVVKIEWIKTVSEANAEKELGFFGNQNTVCRPKAQRWEYTVERLKKIWNIDT